MTNHLIAVLLSLQLITMPIALEHMARNADVDPRLAACIVQHESGWNTMLVSRDKDSGLFQIIPSTATWVAKQMGLTEYDLLDPAQNMEMGLWILKHFPEWYSTLKFCE